MKIIILGGGFSGLSSAFYLQKAGIECEVYEKEDRVGGVCRTETHEGFTYDHCGHLLHFRDPGTKTFVHGFVGKELLNHTRRAWIFSKGVYTRYPFQSNLYGLPREVIEDCLLGIIEARSRKHALNQVQGRSMNFEEWIYTNFGKGIGKHFMIPYNQKLWTVHPSELTTDWMGRFVPQVTLKEILQGALTDSKTQLGYNVTFDYPKKGGIEFVAKTLASKVSGIHTHKKAFRILTSKKIIQFEGGLEKRFDHLISTIPLPELIQMMEGVPEKVRNSALKLRHTSILNLSVGINRPKISEKHWVYVPEERFLFYRVGFPSNLSPYASPKGTSTLSVEVAYRKRKPQRVVERVMKGLKEMGLLKEEDRILFLRTIPIPYAYVIYDQNYRSSRQILLGYLERKGFYSIGRFGGWRYSSIEDVLLEGKETAKKIVDRI